MPDCHHVSVLGKVCNTPKHTLQHTPVLTLFQHYSFRHSVFDTVSTHTVFQVCCCVYTHTMLRVCSTHTVFGCVNMQSVEAVLHCLTYRVLSVCILQYIAGHTVCTSRQTWCNTVYVAYYCEGRCWVLAVPWWSYWLLFHTGCCLTSV